MCIWIETFPLDIFAYVHVIVCAPFVIVHTFFCIKGMHKNAQLFNVFLLLLMKINVNMKVMQIVTLNIKEIHEVEEVKVSECPDKSFTVIC